MWVFLGGLLGFSEIYLFLCIWICIGLYFCTDMIKTVFNKDKAIQAVLYVANGLLRKDFHKIFKILYFADRNHIAEWGCPITGDIYIAMDAGPVPSRIYDMFKIVRGDAYSQDTEGLGEFFGVEGWMYIVPKREVDKNKLSPSDIASLQSALDTYGNMTYDEIKEKSHDVAWRATAKDYAISWEDIAREAGLDSEDIGYIAENIQLQQMML